MEESNWEVTTERFVLFFDILGFKDLVQRSTHEEVLEKLVNLKNSIKDIEQLLKSSASEISSIDSTRIKSTTFSDSIIFFSQAATYNDIATILLAGTCFLDSAFIEGIPLKGVFSFGRITVDFERNIFFGQPIIDAYLLQEELQVLWIVADNNFEMKYELLTDNRQKKHVVDMLYEYKIPLRSKRVRHKMLIPATPGPDIYKDGLKKMYMSVSGNPRIYIDNTLDFLEYYRNEEEKKDKPQSDKSKAK